MDVVVTNRSVGIACSVGGCKKAIHDLNRYDDEPAGAEDKNVVTAAANLYLIVRGWRYSIPVRLMTLVKTGSLNMDHPSVFESMAPRPSSTRNSVATAQPFENSSLRLSRGFFIRVISLMERRFSNLLFLPFRVGLARVRDFPRCATVDAHPENRDCRTAWRAKRHVLGELKMFWIWGVFEFALLEQRLSKYSITSG